MSTYTSCPNCGAAITGRICEYCGTIHDASPYDLKGRKAILIAIDDNENVIVQGCDISSVSIERPTMSTYAEDMCYRSLHDPVVIMEGRPLPATELIDRLQKTKDVLNKKFQ